MYFILWVIATWFLPKSRDPPQILGKCSKPYWKDHWINRRQGYPDQTPRNWMAISRWPSFPGFWVSHFKTRESQMVLKIPSHLAFWISYIHFRCLFPSLLYAIWGYPQERVQMSVWDANAHVCYITPLGEKKSLLKYKGSWNEISQ